MKNGDKVRIIKSSSVNQVGDIGVLEGDSKGVFQVNVAGRSQDRNWHTASEVELVEETKTYTTEEVNVLISELLVETLTQDFQHYVSIEFLDQFKKDKGLIPSLVSGWKKDNELSKWIVYYNFETFEIYGLDVGGYWFTYKYKSLKELLKRDSQEDNREATSEEILKALTAEAIKQGIVFGCEIETLVKDCVDFYEPSRTSTYYFEDNVLWFGSEQIMKDGKWATVVNTEEDELKKALQAAQDALENYKNK